MTDPFFHPVSGFDLPRFAGIPTFLRLPHVPPDHPRFAEVQIGLIGAPCDGGTTNRPGPGLPVAIPTAIALRQTGRILFAARRTGRGAHVQLHQAFSGKADHRAQQVSVRALLNKRPQVHHLVGHRWSLRFRVGVSNQTLAGKRR